MCYADLKIDQFFRSLRLFMYYLFELSRSLATSLGKSALVFIAVDYLKVRQTVDHAKSRYFNWGAWAARRLAGRGGMGIMS